MQEEEMDAGRKAANESRLERKQQQKVRGAATGASKNGQIKWALDSKE